MRLRRRQNYRGRDVAFPLGAPILALSIVLLPLCLALGLDLGRWPAYLCGVALLGLIDDAFGADGPRGLRGHGAAVAGGTLSTGAIKALGTLALAAYAASGVPEAMVLVLAPHVGNLLDTGPGRVEKALGLVLVAVLAAGAAGSLEPLVPFLIPVGLGAWFTLRERAMLGDSGASLCGGMAGVALVSVASGPALYTAVCGLIAISLYGEFRSIASSIGRVPLLQRLDSLGRSN